MGDQVGVERVVSGDQDGEGVTGVAAGPSHLLPPGRPGPGEPCHQHGVEPRHVDPQLEGVGRGQPEQAPVAQRLLDLAALLGQVAAAVAGHPGRKRRVDLGEQTCGGRGHLLGGSPGPDEGQRPDPLADQVGQQVGGLGRRSAAHGGAVLAGVRREARLPQRDGGLAARRVVVADRPHVETGEPRRVLGRVAHGGRGQHERRVGAVDRADPAEAAQHLGDVGAEDAAVVVALVDHHEVERPEQSRPAVVPREQRAVEHVGVGEDVLAVLAGPVALVVRRVAVVGGDAHPEPEGGHRCESWSWARALVGLM